MDNLNQPFSNQNQLTTEQQQSISLKSSSHPKALLIASVLFILIFVSLTTFILGSRTKLTSQPPPSSISQPSPTPLPAETSVKEGDPTANWKTYVNTKYRYSIKYPSVYTPYGFDSNRNPLPNNINNENAYYVMFRNQPIPTEYYDALPNALWVAFMSRKEFEDFKTKLEEAVKKAPCGGCPTKSTASINDIVADVYDGHGGYTLDKIFLIKYKERFYMLSYDRATDPKYATYPYDVSEAMINSFKFLDQENQVVCTQDAKMCPDGSYVSRQPPNCEFAKCP